jgi:hypothetical protein
VPSLNGTGTLKNFGELYEKNKYLQHQIGSLHTVPNSFNIFSKYETSSFKNVVLPLLSFA